MSLSAADVKSLRDAYREAGAAIENLTDPTERSVGLAALRLEASTTVQYLATTATNVSDETLAPLERYVRNLVGGAHAEALVGKIDAKAKKAARTVLWGLTKSLATGTLVGILATVVGVAAVITSSGVSAGRTVLLSAVTGVSLFGVYLFFAALGAIGEAVQSAKRGWLRSIGWATELGSASDGALQHARDLQQSVIARATGTDWVPKRFTLKARGRAIVLVGSAWALLAAAVLLFAIGFWQGLSDPVPKSPPSKSAPSYTVPGVTVE